MRQLYLLFILCILPFTIYCQNILGGSVKIPNSIIHGDSVEIIFISATRHNSETSKNYKICLVNPTKDTIRFYSFSRSRPWFFYRGNKDGISSKEQSYYFCYTGAGYSVLLPGNCYYGYLWLEEISPQIGLEYTILPDASKFYTVWSKPIL